MLRARSDSAVYGMVVVRKCNARRRWFSNIDAAIREYNKGLEKDCLAERMNKARLCCAGECSVSRRYLDTPARMS